MGGSFFCLKACDPAGQHAADYCQHIFDRIGCAYNAPNNAQNGTFEVCKGDNQDYPGVYTSDGQVVTYTQPAESLGAITTMPYTPKVPASSECTSYASSDLYSEASAFFVSSVSGFSATASGGSSSKPTGSSGSGSSSRSAGGSQASSTDASAAGLSIQRSNGVAAGAAIAFMGMLGAAAAML